MFSKFNRLSEAIANAQSFDYIYAQDVGDSGAKVFVAAPQDVFIKRYNRDLALVSEARSMNWYEVITGRCRLYVDIDDSTLEELFSALSWLKAQFPGDFFRIFHRDECSFHIIGSSTFESPKQLGDALYERCAPTSFDMSIYSKNRCWKLPFSRKFGKGSMMVPFDVEDLSEMSITAEDLVAVAPVDMTASVASSGAASSGTSATRTVPPAEIPAEILCHLARLRRFYGDFYDITEMQPGVYRLCCHSRICAIAKRRHRRNHIFIVVDTVNKRYAQCCFNERCQRQAPLWNSL